MFHADVYSNCDNGGGDLRFSSDEAGSSQLACEVEHFDTGASQGEVYVSCSLTASSDFTIYIWGDNTGQSQPAASDTYGSDNVYDSNFIGVYHLSTDGTDSTSNGHDLTASGTPDDVTGFLSARSGAGAQDFTPNEYYYSSDVAFGLTADYTYSYIFELDSIASNNGLLGKYDASDGYFDYHRNNDDGWTSSSRDLSPGGFSTGALQNPDDFTPTVALVINTAYYVGHATDEDVAHYGRIENNNSCTKAISSGSLVADSNNFTLGAMLANSFYINGHMDEFRISNINRGHNWLTTEYNNMRDQDNFGTAAAAGGGAPAGIAASKRSIQTS